MSSRIVCALALVASCGLAGSARAEVKLTINDGRVSLTATNATVREILAEWARVGKTTVVNGERVAGTPITIQLTNVYEQQALDVILRSVSAYLAAPRPSSAANWSRFDRIIVLPTSTPPRNAPAPATPTFAQPPQFNPAPPPVSIDDDDVPARPGIPTPRGPIFQTFPQPQITQPPNPNTPPPRVGGPTSSPTPGAAPIGVPIPGMIVQPPQQPGQPGQIPPQDR